MGNPVKLDCAICGDTYYLHPADERPVEYADLCYTCECFKKGMKRLRDEGDPLVMGDKDLPTMGKLILGLSAIFIVILVAWEIWRWM